MKRVLAVLILLVLPIHGCDCPPQPRIEIDVVDARKMAEFALTMRSALGHCDPHELGIVGCYGPPNAGCIGLLASPERWSRCMRSIKHATCDQLRAWWDMPECVGAMDPEPVRP